METRESYSHKHFIDDNILQRKVGSDRKQLMRLPYIGNLYDSRRKHLHHDSTLITLNNTDSIVDRALLQNAIIEKARDSLLLIKTEVD